MKTATIRVQDQERPWPKGTTVFIGAEDGTEWYIQSEMNVTGYHRWYFDPEEDTTGLFGQDDETPDTFVVGETRVEGDDVIYTFEY